MSSRLAVLVACAGAYLAFLDTTIVNTSFPDIAASFPAAGRAEMSWVLDSYFIVIAALLVPAGGLADRLGRKRTFLFGVALFAVTSLACAVAPSWQLLVVARVLQGVAAAIIAPVSLALVLPEYDVRRRAQGVALWGAAAALAAASGPPLGGLLVEVADWRWIFLVNVPLCALVLLAGRRALTEARDERAGLPDLGGAALLAGALGLLALGIVEGEGWGWSSAPVLGSFAGAALLLGAVVARCLHHPRPVVDPALMRIPSFARANAATLLFSMAFFSTILGNILFLTSIWDYSVLSAGLAVVPGPLATVIASPPAGRLAQRFGFRAVIVPGALLYVAGLLILRSAGPDPDYLGTWLPGMIVGGIGIGLAFPTLGAAAVAEVPSEQFGVASAVSSAWRQFGAVLGTALLVAIVGEPASAAEALSASDRGYLLAIFAASGAAVVSLALAPHARATVETAPVHA